MREMKIGDRLVGNNLDPYIIADIGVNHECSMDLARRLIDEAAEGGAHAAKFQSYKAGKIASKHSPAYWDLSKEPTKSQYELFKKYDAFGPQEYEKLAEHCRKVGIDFMSTPFDLDTVAFLEPLMPAFKIASADITNTPLIRKVARAGKPVILSTGAATLPEIEFAVDLIRAEGCSELALMHCVLNYPTVPERAQLGMIQALKRAFPDFVIGYSDHVAPDENLTCLTMAALLGASILEKHFTHDKTLEGNDHYHAMDREDLVTFARQMRLRRTLIGEEAKNIAYEESARKNARRSVVAARKIKKGTRLTEKNLITKRPGFGISPVFWDDLIGRRAARTIEKDQLLTWADLEEHE